MNCQQAIEYIHSLLKFGIKPGLERIEALCASLGNPQDKLKYIHVAGTNGKGSTSTMISNILIKSGYNVGLYTSPYVTDFRERIMFNSSMIEKDELAFCVEKVKAAADSLDGVEITEFEFLTAVAFVYFEMKKCDFVVLEVGLGGRFDATNVINNPLVCVISSISLDHTAILGDTVEQVAFEKCGIIKKGAEVVSYFNQQSEALKVIENTCYQNNCNLIIPDKTKLKIGDEKLNGTCVHYDGLDYLLPLAGEHMAYNLCTAVEAVRALKNYDVIIDQAAYVEGVKSSVMPARIELIKSEPVILLDGGHNEGCAEALAAFIKKHLINKKLVIVASLMADKDYKTYLSKVAVMADTFIAATADVPRALPSGELAEAALPYCRNVFSVSNSVDAVKKAKEMLDAESALVICGSFYLAGEIRDIILNF